MSWVKDALVLSPAILVAAGAVAFIVFAFVHRNDPVHERPCSTFASDPRERVPARCFGDFHPER